jgi:arylsulfatase A-like enzyme
MAERIRYDCIGSSRMRLSKTPYLDWLAGNGVWFEKAYTPQPNFGLAQSVLMCGERVNGDYYFPKKESDSRPALCLDDSWSKWLREQQWLCSWLGDWKIKGYDPEDFGYERLNCDDAENPAVLASAAVSWLHENGQKGLPWHLCLSFADAVSDPDQNELSDVPLSPWPNFTDELNNKPMAQKRLQQRSGLNNNLWSDWSKRASNSVRQATRLDEAVGVLVSQINQLGLLEDTLIIFTAASGSMCGSHRLVGNEYSCYEEIMHVPMLLHWPGVIPAGLRCERLVSSMLDLPATLFALLRDERPDRLQGFDLSCFWTDRQESGDVCKREGILSGQIGLGQGLYTQRMYRDNRYKYVWNPTDLDELYDLEKDPYELVNRIETDSRQKDRLRRLMAEEMRACNDQLADVLSLETGEE